MSCDDEAEASSSCPSAPGCSYGRILGGNQLRTLHPCTVRAPGLFTNFRQLTGRLFDAPAAPDCTDAPEKVGLTAIRTISFSRWRRTIKAPLIVGPLPLSVIRAGSTAVGKVNNRRLRGSGAASNPRPSSCAGVMIRPG
jgi:hypothetical protein